MTSPVGTNIGEVHQPLHQGVGLATVLTGDKAIDTYGRVAVWDKAKRDEIDAAARRKREEALTAIRNTEAFYKHDDEISNEANSLIDYAAAEEAAGRNPFQSKEFLKRSADLRRKSQYSMQIKDQYKKLMDDLNAENPDDFTAASVSAAKSYFDMPLSEIVEKGLTMPILEKKSPWVNAYVEVGKAMQQLMQTNGQNPSDQDVMGFIKSYIAEPASSGVIKSYATKYSQLEKSEQTAIEDRARTSGVTIPAIMAFDDAVRFRKGQEPMDYLKEIKDAVALAEGGIDYKKWGTTSARGTKATGVDDSVKTAVDTLFNRRSDWMTYYDRNGELPRATNETDVSYAARVKALMASKIKPLIGLDTGYETTGKAEGEQEVATSQRHFIEDMKSGDPVRSQAAANFLIGTNVFGNLDIEQANIVSTPGGYALQMSLSTPMSLAEVKQEVIDAGGSTSEDVVVEERQGRKEITIGLGKDDIVNQRLIRLHDATIKSTGQKYLTKFTERTPTGVMQAMKSVVDPAAPPKTKKTDLNSLFD